MSKVERAARGERAGKITQMLFEIEVGLTPFLKARLTELHGTTSFVAKENARRGRTRQLGGKIKYLDSDASVSEQWDHLVILRTISSLWPAFEPSIDLMIGIRNRVSHTSIGPVSDQDLVVFSNFAEHLLRACGALEEAEFVRGLVPNHSAASMKSVPLIPTVFPDLAKPVEPSDRGLSLSNDAMVPPLAPRSEIRTPGRTSIAEMKLPTKTLALRPAKPSLTQTRPVAPTKQVARPAKPPSGSVRVAPGQVAKPPQLRRQGVVVVSRAARPLPPAGRVIVEKRPPARVVPQGLPHQSAHAKAHPSAVDQAKQSPDKGFAYTDERGRKVHVTFAKGPGSPKKPPTGGQLENSGSVDSDAKKSDGSPE